MSPQGPKYLLLQPPAKCMGIVLPRKSWHSPASASGRAPGGRCLHCLSAGLRQLPTWEWRAALPAARLLPCAWLHVDARGC